MTAVNTKSNLVLGFFAVVSLCAFLLVEHSRQNVKQDWYDEKIQAVALAQKAASIVKDHQMKRGVFIDKINDPNETALIGQDITPITTDRGYLGAKLTSTNPNFAAVLIEQLKRAGLAEHDYVAVAMTGSFPALNIAVLSALETLKLTPVIICSVGSSNWGANDPQYTWLDMEHTLNDAGIFNSRTVAASVGGGGDIGQGLSTEGRDMIIRAIKRNGVELINEVHLERSIDRRLKIYDTQANGNQFKAYINIGGGIASLGTTVNGEIIPNGLSMALPVKNYPIRGVLIEMAKLGVPVIHLFDIRKLWIEYGLPLNPIPLPELGDGGIFVREKYNKLIAWIAVAVLSVLIFFAGYMDRRRHRLGSEHASSVPTGYEL
jgi:poly-gamma-glutamate system protein